MDKNLKHTIPSLYFWHTCNLETKSRPPNLYTVYSPSKVIIIIIIYPLTARVIGAPQMIWQSVFSIFPCSLLPSGTWRTPGLSNPWSLMLSSHLFLCLPCLLSSFTVPCKMVLARPDELETWPYRCSLRLFLIVRRSSCGPVACWILAQTSSFVTWFLYEMRSVLR